MSSSKKTLPEKKLRDMTRVERRAAKNQIIAHLALHGFFPVNDYRIAQKDGLLYTLGSAGVTKEARHNLVPRDETHWPRSLGVLKCLAKAAGMLL